MTLLCLIGGPYSGRSTLMQAWMAQWRSQQVEELPFAHTVCGDGPSPSPVILGHYNHPTDGGTDRLARDIRQALTTWLGWRPAPLVAGEGDRLNNAEFLLTTRARVGLVAVQLDTPYEVAVERLLTRSRTRKEPAAVLSIDRRWKQANTVAERIGALRIDGTASLEDQVDTLNSLIGVSV